LCQRPLPKPLPRSGRGFSSGLIFLRQHPIEFYITDFYYHNLRLVIEVGGENHTEKKIQNHEKGRSGELERYGIKVIRFTNNQILHYSNQVIEKTKATIKELVTTS
jgi:very-short-patch-repair endonuclease